MSSKEKENTKEFISLKEAEEFCNYSADYLRLRARQEKLRAKKMGRMWVTTQEWVEEYEKDMEKYWESKRVSDESEENIEVRVVKDEPSTSWANVQSLFRKMAPVVMSLILVFGGTALASHYQEDIVSGIRSSTNYLASVGEGVGDGLSDLSSKMRRGLATTRDSIVGWRPFQDRRFVGVNSLAEQYKSEWRDYKNRFNLPKISIQRISLGEKYQKDWKEYTDGLSRMREGYSEARLSQIESLKERYQNDWEGYTDSLFRVGSSFGRKYSEKLSGYKTVWKTRLSRIDYPEISIQRSLSEINLPRLSVQKRLLSFLRESKSQLKEEYLSKLSLLEGRLSQVDYPEIYFRQTS